MKQFEDVLTSSVGAVSRALDTRVKGIPLVLYNPVAFPVSEVIEISLKTPTKSDGFVVYNEAGKIIPSQLIASENGQVKMLVDAAMPSCGYVVYDIREERSKSSSKLKVSNNSIENSIYRLRLDKNGDISSVFDKINNIELVEKGKSIRLALFTENESPIWPAWEILKIEIDKTPISISEAVKVSVVEQGPVRATLCVEKTYGKSTFKQYIRMTEGGRSDRIDIFNEIDWQSTNALLKAEFPLNVSNSKATYDLGIGAVERGNNTDIAYEVYGQYWADLTDISGDYGVSVLNDCKYGWDKPTDNTIRLTLLHTPKTKVGFTYQEEQDLGKHIFTYSIIGHVNDYRNANIVQKAEILNQVPKAFIAQKHKGTLGKSFSFVGNTNNKVIIKAIKVAEKSDEYVVRLYETIGKKTEPVTLRFAGNIHSAKELNGVEDEKGDVKFAGNEMKFDIEPFGMKIFKVKLSAPENKLDNPKSTPLNLPYNMKSATYNAFMDNSNFDGKGNSFAAELLPAKITFKGIDFTSAGADTQNVVKCRNQVIDLPQGDFDRLYLLVASTANDTKTTFMVDNKEYEVVVPAYSRFIGQWGHTGYTDGFLKSANVAYVGTHKHNMLLHKDLPYEFTYMFTAVIDLPKNSKQLILPDNSRIVVFAGTMIQDENNDVKPVVDLLKVNLANSEEALDYFSKKNLLFGKPIIEKSGEINRNEKAEFATDEDTNTKWCDTSISKPKFITVDLEKVETIRGWSVFHAGLEALDYISKEYNLQIKLNGSDKWKTVDAVSDNTSIETDRLLQTAEKARYVRLNVTKPDQSEGSTLRIFDFQVY